MSDTMPDIDAKPQATPKASTIGKNNRVLGAGATIKDVNNISLGENFENEGSF
jgi:hypothetical protein